MVVSNLVPLTTLVSTLNWLLSLNWIHISFWTDMVTIIWNCISRKLIFWAEKYKTKHTLQYFADCGCLIFSQIEILLEKSGDFDEIMAAAAEEAEVAVAED